MLCLSRKPTQTIQIGDEITITVLELSGEQVRFGIDAPKHVAVLREELLARIASKGRNEPDNRVVQHESAMAMDGSVKPDKPKPKITYKRRMILPSNTKA
jgi:carbon storage regulator